MGLGHNGEPSWRQIEDGPMGFSRTELSRNKKSSFSAEKITPCRCFSFCFQFSSCIMVAPAISVPATANLSIASRNVNLSNLVYSHRNPWSIASSLPSPHGDPEKIGFSSKSRGLPLKLDEKSIHDASTSYGAIEAKRGNAPVMPAVFAPGGPMDLSSVLFRNRIKGI